MTQHRHSFGCLSGAAVLKLNEHRKAFAAERANVLGFRKKAQAFQPREKSSPNPPAELEDDELRRLFEPNNTTPDGPEGQGSQELRVNSRIQPLPLITID